MKPKDTSRKRRTEEWDEREKEWTRIMRTPSRNSDDPVNSAPGKSQKVKNPTRKFNPKKRFRQMVISLSVFLVSMSILIITMNDSSAMLQAVFSMFTTLVSGVIFIMNYGRDLVFSIIAYLTRYSLR
jgi:hypothetical protein